MKTSIWWIRRDLRLSDNPALVAALDHGDQVVPIFILDPKLRASASSRRAAFLYASLEILDQSLRQSGSRLILREGDPVKVLQQLAVETSADAVFAEPDYTPYARQRDARASRFLPVYWKGSPCVRPPGGVLKPDGTPYTIFTPFSKTWKRLPPPESGDILPAPAHIHTPAGLASLPIPVESKKHLDSIFPPGEAPALKRLESFVRSASAPVYRYAGERDRLDLEGTSLLSPYLRLGMISARQAAAAAYTALWAAPGPQAARSAETWLNELIWREFYLHILYHFPQVKNNNFRDIRINWHNDLVSFEAWKQGLTGYPVVDASMRQLLATGWMHNRARMISASFLTKDLLVDWRWGEAWFMEHLIDGDPAANNGGWQWTAGTGTDAAPYFRIFNPVLQGLRYDPQGKFIRSWLPELCRVPKEYLHTPWKLTAHEQASLGFQLGVDYPAPIVEHEWARERALRSYGTSKP